MRKHGEKRVDYVCQGCETEVMETRYKERLNYVETVLGDSVICGTCNTNLRSSHPEYQGSVLREDSQ
jgi:predicted SprT family Zn-dependent metalloprotease